ncbi:zinc ABC transporter permease AztB [Microbacterium halotolerans]|uniref:zinc ABC transporter permease AztB n=1 Tax=Microbacterium halotolerans TaxID=246613 RepID=UPI000E6ADDD5|nr:zinc ABC transporter permease AztB [Microbacterium halotolerans]
MTLLLPFTSEFMVRALVGGTLVAAVCAVVGTWVVVRGMAFLGEAISHGMLPGVAIATLLGIPPLWGAAVSGAAMSAAIGLLQRRGRLSYDTSIGLLFVGMLSLGVIIVSHSRSFATDATTMLFGDILAVGWSDVLILATTLAVVATIAAVFHRSFVAATFDPRIAHTLGLRPHLAHTLLTTLVTVAVIASYQSVGTLLVVGMLLAPAVAAGRWTRSIPTTMALAAAFGIAAVVIGLTVSWHAATAAGPTIACTAIVLAAASALTSTAVHRTRTRNARHVPAHPAAPAPIPLPAEAITSAAPRTESN